MISPLRKDLGSTRFTTSARQCGHKYLSQGTRPKNFGRHFRTLLVRSSSCDHGFECQAGASVQEGDDSSSRQPAKIGISEGDRRALMP